jgi:hypothetical protein
MALIDYNEKKFQRYLGPIFVALLAIAVTSPSFIDDAPFNYDESVFLCTGTYFSTMISDFSGFVSDPIQWSKNYYNQYPVISLRRHPPLFFAVEGVFFSVFGTTHYVGRVTLLLFTIAFALGFFRIALRYFDDQFRSIVATIVLLSVTSSIPGIQEVWLDVPTMAWAVWGIYYWDIWRVSSTYKSGICCGLCCVCALYTYQLSLFLVVAMFGVGFFLWWKAYLKRSESELSGGGTPFRGFLAIAVGFTLLLSPLVVFSVLFGSDQLQVAAGGQVAEFARFSKASATLSIDNLTLYLRVLRDVFPISILGAGYFFVSRFFKSEPMKELDLLFLFAFLLTYAGFSIVSSFNVRYCWYIVIPTVLWSVQFLFWTISIVGLKAWQSVAVIVASLGLLVYSASQDYSERFLRDPIDMHQVFFEVKGGKKILYSGTYDARFVFTVRSQDPSRKYSLYRGTVQVSHKDNLSEFLLLNDIDTVVVQLSDDVNAVPEYQRMEKKLLDQLPGLGFVSKRVIDGHEFGKVDRPMLVVYRKSF